MRKLRIAGDVVVGGALGWALHAFVAAQLPRLDGPLPLALMVAGSVILVLFRYPGALRRILTADLNVDLNTAVPPIAIKAVMAWVGTLVGIAMLTILLQVWDRHLPDWAFRVLFFAAFALWFIPDLRHWAARRGRRHSP